MAENLLTLSGVHTHIGPYHILQGVDLAVPEGGVTVLLGRNGAGKTTTLRTIMGLWTASQGDIRFGDHVITKLSTPEISRRGIAFVPEDMGIFTDLTVAENMILAAANGPMDQKRLAWIKELFPPIGSFWNSSAGTLSGGQKQMLSVARAIIEPRRLILIDEPTKGLAPAIIKAMTDALKELKETDTTILLVEQNFAMASGIGDTVAVMDDGRIIHSGRMDELVADVALQEKLMGLSLEAHQ
ncbi:ABC transporter ATP-binding protein [Labrenzia sp. C1B10]|uniref:ABC transporter ATP-binding protein n=1 Tax=Stappiaceae TaxID=2821832 RepID=UPI0003B8BA34|nr:MULTISPECIES: ABC transporter ATP-binding protein [unclassified Labrenzia]MEC9403465.1 ABC transporter ATP-binding protein [Pseudomonadota bacterium]ERP86219.1 ABC transporter ATP-binding protein [Labrenzia sp. C1B10]ERS06771.1 ABC transporter ATP-binding protein [Labrenzia sp. C1B70]MEC9472688.1 ABC transporter ATP-binding protein [Pseudomonadota bacterium]QFT67330.1 High-affinity branched-chain amino acid transport ATP-binding protein LivF [Labrenzia sp. THAF35]